MADPDHRTLVLGGGGVTGIAWATGLIVGLERSGIDLRAADRLVGTSAGAAISAQLTGQMSTETLFQRQVDGTVHEIPGSLGLIGMARVVLPLMLSPDQSLAQRMIGRFATGAGTEQAGARRAVIEQRIDGADWNPDRDLRLVAVDVDSGRPMVFTPHGPATLTEAVEASCAVPGVWPVVSIDGRRYMDGGFLSPANVPMAGDTSGIVVIAPLTQSVRPSSSPHRQLDAMGMPGTVVSPDDDAKAAMGSNPLDPAARAASAEAGLAQAERVADAVRAVW